jgi:invasion protein IalB
MARSTSAVLAALIAVAPLAAAYAQAPAEQTPPPATTPAAPADAAAPAPQGEAAPAEAPAAATAPAEGAAADPAEGQAQAPAAGNAQDQVGSYYTHSMHGDWQLRCLRTQDGKDPCELYQLLRDDQQTPVAEFSVIPYSGEAAAIINFVAPLETDLEAGMAMQIDSGETKRYPFMVCAPIGCVSRLGVTQAELDAMKNGKSGTVSLLPFGSNPQEDRVQLTVSLSGFTAGYSELQKVLEANK